MKKRVLLFCLFMSLFSSMFAGGLYQGSAGTLGDDTSGFFDLLDWDSLDFGNQIFYTSLDNSTPINVSYAKKNESNQLQLGYAGNLWSEKSKNIFRVLYGFGNKAIGFALEQESTELNTVAGSNYDMTLWIPTGGFGINITDNFGLSVGAGIGSGSILGYENRIIPTVYAISTLLKATRVSTDTMTDYFTVGYDGIFEFLNDNSSTSNNMNIYIHQFLGTYNLAYYCSDIFTYGLNIALPIQFYDIEISNSQYWTQDTLFMFIISNGFVLDLKPEVLQISAGLKTELPFIDVSTVYNKKGSQTAKGNVNNTVYVGAALNVINGVHVDFNSALNIFDGISIEELWKSSWTLSVTASF